MDLSVEHDGTEDLSILHSDPEIIQSLLMILMSPVGEIKPGNIHPSPQKLLHHRNWPRRRSQRAHDLRLRNTPIVGKLLQYPLDVYIRHRTTARSIPNKGEMGVLSKSLMTIYEQEREFFIFSICGRSHTYFSQTCLVLRT